MTDAERVARLEQALLRCLELSRQGCSDALKLELERALGDARAGLGGPLSDHEIDRAFAAAEPVSDEVIDADRVAQRALCETDLGLEDDLAGAQSSFATRTMADLLERQGDVASASRIRARIGGTADSLAHGPGAASGWDARRAAWIVTLETWLENLRRGASR